MCHWTVAELIPRSGFGLLESAVTEWPKWASFTRWQSWKFNTTLLSNLKDLLRSTSRADVEDQQGSPALAKSRALPLNLYDDHVLGGPSPVAMADNDIRTHS
jgi:hypothetical protein